MVTQEKLVRLIPGQGNHIFSPFWHIEGFVKS